MKSLNEQRRQYGQSSLERELLPEQPWRLLKQWLAEAIDHPCLDATAFVLATLDDNHPDARVVLAKEVNEQGLIFYTSYASAKGQQLNKSPTAAGCFYWPQFARQVRIQGSVTKTSRLMSERYFDSRPKMSQAAAIVSAQSQPLESRRWLEEKAESLLGQSLVCPENWGGFCLEPSRFEFFQGRDNRINDRFQAKLSQENRWVWQRLAP